MLTLVMGPAKSGKTSYLFSEIEKNTLEGKRSLLLVPEQASFTSEKRIASLKERAALVTPTSFSRLAELTLREYGGDGRSRMTDTAAFFLMDLALEEIGEELSVYRRNYRTHGFLEQMLGVARECADAGISPADLARFSYTQPQGILREKCFELSLILDAYDAVVHRGWQSAGDELTLAAQRIAEADAFSEVQVYADGFFGFTAPEYRMLEALLVRSADVTVALPGDDSNPPKAAFAYCADTAGRLLRMAERNGLKSRKVILPPSEREGLPAAFLDAMECDAMPRETRPFSQIRVLRPQNPAEEAETVAAQIVRLVRQEGYRWRDISVVMRTDERYRILLPAALRRCGVPFFLDVRGEARSGALLQGVQAAVLLAAGDREGDPLRLLKSPILGLDETAAAETENYCFVWSVRPSGWNTPFLNHPDGMTDRWTQEDKERLQRIEACRRAVTEPVEALRAAMRGGGDGFAAGLYRWLCSVGAAQNLTRFAAPMEENARREFLAQQSLLWDKLMETLDLFAAVGKGLSFTPRRIVELLDLALSTAQVALPPRTLDEVTVGTADRMRIEGAKAVFLLGAVQGEFPAYHVPGGLLSNDERRALIEGGLTLLGDSDRFLDNERMIVYQAACAAEKELFVSAPRAELTGEALVPSELYERAAALTVPKTSEPFSDVVTAEAALRRYAALPKHTPEAAALRRLCEETGHAADAGRIDRARERLPHELTDAALAKRLFGEKMRLSPTRLEQYYRCPYAYFAQNGLGVHAMQKAELSPVQTGTLVHRVLERIVSRYGGASLHTLPEQTLRDEIRRETEDYLSEVVADVGAVPKRLLAGFERVGGWLYELLRRLGEEFSRSLFEPAAFELPVREGSAVEPLHLLTADGCEVLVQGTVDRVDTATVNGRRYVRVVDYKSGGKSFRLQDVYYGLNMQMLLYLFSIWENGRGEWKDTLPAGVLYLPALGKYTLGGRDGETAVRDLQKQYRMNGLLLRDPDVLSAMETDGEAIFIPVKPDTEKSDALATLAELGRLRRLVEERVTGMAERLRAGEIPALPADTANDPCRYCDFRGVCGFEAGDEKRALLKKSREEIFGEEENDGIFTDA